MNYLIAKFAKKNRETHVYNDPLIVYWSYNVLDKPFMRYKKKLFFQDAG